MASERSASPRYYLIESIRIAIDIADSPISELDPATHGIQS
jgi:hypothetical protein